MLGSSAGFNSSWFLLPSPKWSNPEADCAGTCHVRDPSEVAVHFIHGCSLDSCMQLDPSGELSRDEERLRSDECVMVTTRGRLSLVHEDLQAL
ncbi:hypothetical protein PFISCL1PPCAC_25308 [Pristionchus fissidentatus]|uniref:Uncharacterized protein n=1 Tax=Pristionchus fissidentatus TaxID=1538716 RepID=A0AAV5WSM2_9BILA|nr:hypothetical protein PFISCL1PPCAC_25308 [Pristionchus fissidentatus]